MRSIAIIGLGKMGRSHLSSFLNSKKLFNLFLFDNNSKILRKLQKTFRKNNKISICKSYPKGVDFDLVVVATKSEERLNVIKKLLKRNRIKYFLLEKFLFNKLDEYQKFEKIHKNSLNKTFVNVWSKKFLELINLKKNNKIFSITVGLPEFKLLTNLIHFYEVFNILSKKKIKVNFNSFKLKKLKNNYYDGRGEIILEDNNGSKMKIYSRSKNNNFYFNYHSLRLNKNVKVSGGKIIVKDNLKKKIFDFPLASKETCKFYEKIISKKKTYVPKYLKISKSSKEIIKLINSEYKKKIKIY